MTAGSGSSPTLILMDEVFDQSLSIDLSSGILCLCLSVFTYTEKPDHISKGIVE